MQDLVPQPGIEPGAPALGVRSPTHWTTREVTLALNLKREERGPTLDWKDLKSPKGKSHTKVFPGSSVQQTNHNIKRHF